MNFEQYCAVIEENARVHGYAMFLPSLYQAADKKQFHVYDAAPSPGSDETVAKAWAQPFLKQCRTVYLAFRGAPSYIYVCEFIDQQQVRQHRVAIEASTYGACR